MTDTQMLKDAIIESGVTITWLSCKMGLSREGLYKKINGETEFKGSEIAALTTLLHLTTEKRETIFFSQNSERHSH